MVARGASRRSPRGGRRAPRGGASESAPGRGRPHFEVVAGGRHQRRVGADRIAVGRLAHRKGRLGVEPLGERAREARRHVLHDQDARADRARKARDEGLERPRAAGRGRDHHQAPAARARAGGQLGARRHGPRRAGERADAGRACGADLADELVAHRAPRPGAQPQPRLLDDVDRAGGKGGGGGRGAERLGHRRGTGELQRDVVQLPGQPRRDRAPRHRGHPRRLERAALVDRTRAHGGRVSMASRPDGTSTVYELNLGYLDALCTPDEAADPAILAAKGLAAHSILFAFLGVPAVYYHSLVGSPPDHQGMRSSESTGVSTARCSTPTGWSRSWQATRRRAVFEGMRTCWPYAASSRRCPPSAPSRSNASTTGCSRSDAMRHRCRAAVRHQRTGETVTLERHRSRRVDRRAGHR